MNPNLVEKFFKAANEVSLDGKKKDAIHQEVLLFMKKNPFNEESIIKKNWFSFLVYPRINSFKLKMPAVVLAGMMLFLLVGGIVSVKADTALPGDLLYPIKIGFNEKIEEALTFSHKAKLDLNIKLAELRLQEAEQLALQGKLNNNNETRLNNNFQDHAVKASVYVGQLNEGGDDKKLETISTNFEASLRAHSIIINGLRKNATNHVTGPLVSDIENITSTISTINTHADNNSGTGEKSFNEGKEKAIREKISTIENSVNTIKKLIEDNKVSIGAQAISETEDNLNLVQQKIDEGKRHIENNNNDYQSSESSLQQASIIAQESRDLVDTKTHLGIDIPINISSPSDNHDNQGIQSNQNKEDTTKTNTKMNDSLQINNLLK